MPFDEPPTAEEVWALRVPEDPRRGAPQALSDKARDCCSRAYLNYGQGHIRSNLNWCKQYTCKRCATYRIVTARRSWLTQYDAWEWNRSPLFSEVDVVHYLAVPDFLRGSTLKERIKERDEKFRHPDRRTLMKLLDARVAGLTLAPDRLNRLRRDARRLTPSHFWYLRVPTVDQVITVDQGAHRISHYFSSHALGARTDLWPALELDPAAARDFYLETLLTPQRVAAMPTDSDNFPWPLNKRRDAERKEDEYPREVEELDPFAGYDEDAEGFLTDLSSLLATKVVEIAQRMIDVRTKVDGAPPTRSEAYRITMHALRQVTLGDTPPGLGSYEGSSTQSWGGTAA